MVLRPQAALRDQPQGPDHGLENHPRQHRRQHRAGGDDQAPGRQALRRQRLYRSGPVQDTLAARPDLITGIRRNMRNYLMPLADKIMLRKRFVIETVLDPLKSEMGLEHSRHRSPVNAMVHVLSCLVAYAFRPGKPSISLNSKHLQAYP